jgi:hypothetical protein
MPFAVLTVLPCRAAPGGALAEPAAAYSKKVLELSGREGFEELLARVRGVSGAAPHARLALAFTDPGGTDQLELSDDAQLRTALAMLDDAPARASLLGAARTRRLRS